MFEQFKVRTPTHTCLIDITAQVQRLVTQSGIEEGLCLVFAPHTTAGLTVNENADPTVQSDLIRTLDKLVPWRDGYEHGEGNSAAHVKSSLMGVSHTMPVVGGKLRLGTWQGLYFAEFDGPRTRQVWVKVIAG
ncbi:MAG: YjbQ family protein [Anaerolineae bacterium]|nr:YjbQ family protein [Anaerolineae bacterium]